MLMRTVSLLIHLVLLHTANSLLARAVHSHGGLLQFAPLFFLFSSKKETTVPVWVAVGSGSEPHCAMANGRPLA